MRKPLKKEKCESLITLTLKGKEEVENYTPAALKSMKKFSKLFPGVLKIVLVK